ncbi:heme binding [Pyricularia grisea]|nr:heme binding [Pyricularia grisea]
MISPSELLEHYRVMRQPLAPLGLSWWETNRTILSQLWRESSISARILTLVTGLCLLSILSRLARPRSLRRLGIPGAVQPRFTTWSLDFKKVLEDSAKKYPNSPFCLNAFGTEYVVLPSRCYDEVKRLPEHQASAFAFFKEAFHGSWTGAGVQTPELGRTIAVELTRGIPSLVHWRQKDCAEAFKMCIGEPSAWREIKLFEAIQRIVISVNSSSFVGRELGTDQNWLRAIYNLPLQLGVPTIILGYTPFFLRPFAKPFLFAPLNMTQRKIKRMMKPVLEDDVREYETSADKKNLLSPKEQGKVQLTGWLLSRYKGKLDFQVLLQDFITVLFESTPSTASTLFHVVCELAADPSLQDMLRQELEEQTDHGNLPQTHLNELRKMDSVMRESARVSPFSYLVLYRKLMIPTKLSMGLELPAGTNICVDAHHINNSPELWDRAHEFDGLRHYKARQRPQNENRFKFANLGSDAPSWGDGLQACPGRMFADNTIKIILTHLLLNYDVKLRPGESKPEKGAMPNGSIVPDVWAKVLFRSRVGSDVHEKKQKYP